MDRVTELCRSADLGPPDGLAAGLAAGLRARPAAGGHGQPVSFAGTVGQFYPGRAPAAVLLLSPVGYEEMCCRTTWRSLAESIAAAGIACLRYDHPGTADALDPPVEPDGIEDWRAAALQGAALLRRLAGVERIALVGQGLGAALAASVAAEAGPLAACAYLAPVVDGRRHLRELGMWGRMITDRIGIGPDPDEPAGLSVAGFGLPAGRAAAVRRIDLLAPSALPACPSLVAARPGRAGDAALAARLRAVGADAAEVPYEGYDKLATDPSVAVPPLATIAAVTGWLAQRCAPARPGPARAAEAPGAAASLRGPGYTERALRFGPGGRLFGVLCRPADAPPGRAAVFVGSGRDCHVGLGRTTVLQARDLAARGMASLRFDPGGIGDSPPASAEAGEVLYSRGQIEDVLAAVDLLEASGFAAATLLGRCSGAHAAFHAAVEDPRVDRLVLLNLSRFVWDPAEDVAESLRYGHRRLGDFGAVLGSRDGLRRLIRGDLRVAAAGRHLLRRWTADAGLRLAPALGGLTERGRARRTVRRGFAALAARGVPVRLLYSEGDPGLDELRRYFGPGGRGLAAFENASLGLIADADHNFTHAAARARLLAALAAAAGA